MLGGYMSKKNIKQNTTLTTRDYILYLLNRIELAKIGKIRLNKLAFFVEFGYIYKTNKVLSDAKYAGITLGPVINDYKKILQEMDKAGDIKISGNRIIPLKMPNKQVADNIKAVIDPLIDKFDTKPNNMLVKLSHETDAYKITTDNEKIMGKIIDKKLARLETAFFGEELVETEVPSFPRVDRKKLVPYEFG